MTSPTTPINPPGQPYTGWTPPEQPPRRNWFARHKILTGVGAAFLLFTGIGVAAGGGDGGGGTAAAPSPSAEVVQPTMPPVPSEQKEANDAASKAPPAPPAPTAPELTTAQENAIGSATDYLATQGFSKSGLVEQLKFEGYSTADATFAVNHITVNWDEQAVRVARSYLETQHFSRSGLIAQLRFEGFTNVQATYAAGKVGL